MILGKTKLAVGLLAGLLVAGSAWAQPRTLDTVGEGTVDSEVGAGCATLSGGDCTVTSSGVLKGRGVGKADWETVLTITWGSPAYTQDSGAVCAPAEGTTDITRTNFDIDLNEVGVACESGSIFVGTVPVSNVSYHGAYVVTGGTGKFVGATGTGSSTNLAYGDGSAQNAHDGSLDRP